jgi:hypothetical protein
MENYKTSAENSQSRYQEKTGNRDNLSSHHLNIILPDNKDWSSKINFENSVPSTKVFDISLDDSYNRTPQEVDDVKTKLYVSRPAPGTAQ